MPHMVLQQNKIYLIALNCTNNAACDQIIKNRFIKVRQNL